MSTYYVDMDAANDNGDGAEGNPWKYLNTHINTDVSAGDTVYVREGTYDEGQVTITVNGSSGNVITIAAYTGEAVIWQSGSGDRTFLIEGDYITVDGFDFDKENQYRSAIRVEGTHCTIQNCDIYDGHYYALVELRASASYCTIDNCTIHDNDYGAGQDGQGIGVYGADNVTISDCTIYNNLGVQVFFDDDTGPCNNYLVEDCTMYLSGAAQGCAEQGIDDKGGNGGVIRGCTFYGFRYCDGTCGGTGSPGDAIVIHNEADNITVEQCLIYDSETGIRIESGTTAATIRQNVIRDLSTSAHFPKSAVVIQSGGGSGVDIYNNTFDDCPNYSLRFASSSVVTLRNNIFNDTGQIDNGAAVTADHNCWYGATDTISGTGDVTADPTFTDEVGNDFTLQAGSPCIDAGTNVGLSWEGSGPDIGRYEYSSGPPAGGPIVTVVLYVVVVVVT